MNNFSDSNGLIIQKNELPECDAAGFLPKGFYEVTFLQTAQRFANSRYRLEMWQKLTSFMVNHVVPEEFNFLYIGGGYISDSLYPQDIDIVLETRARFGADSFNSMAPFFKFGLNRILDIYSVDIHFWSEDFPGKMSDYRYFFQYRKSKNIDSEANYSRGVIRIAREHFPIS